MPTSTLVVFAHPDRATSRANRTIFEAESALPNVRTTALYETYPTWQIDVPREQALLTECRRIVLQFPVMWYGMPPMLKLWFDQVWSYGFAFGRGGDALRGKSLLVSATAGGTREMYSREGANERPLEEFLRPIFQIAKFCGLNAEESSVLYDAQGASLEEIADHARGVTERLRA